MQETRVWSLGREDPLENTCAESLPSCPTLYHPMDGSPPGSPAYGTSQARILEWLTISFSGDLPSPRMEPASFMSLALAGEFSITSTPGEGNGNSLQYSCLGNPIGIGQRSLVGYSPWGRKEHTRTHVSQFPPPPWKNPHRARPELQFTSEINTTTVLILNLYVLGRFLTKQYVTETT